MSRPTVSNISHADAAALPIACSVFGFATDQQKLLGPTLCASISAGKHASIALHTIVLSLPRTHVRVWLVQSLALHASPRCSSQFDVHCVFSPKKPIWPGGLYAKAFKSCCLRGHVRAILLRTELNPQLRTRWIVGMGHSCPRMPLFTS